MIGRSPGTRVVSRTPYSPVKGTHLRVGVLGTPCGATSYTFHRLKAAGLEVGHERAQRDGIVCGLWTMPVELRDARSKGRPVHTDYTWDQLVVLIRHPLLVAETLPKVLGNQKMSWHLDDPRLSALRYWVLTFESVPAGLLCIRANKHYEEDFKCVTDALEVESVDIGGGYENTKRRRWDPISWDEWGAHDPEFAERGLSVLDRFDFEERYG